MPTDKPTKPTDSVAATRRPRGAFERLVAHRPDPLTSVVLTIPVFLVYHLGVLLIDYRNGVDLVTELTFRLLEASVPSYVGVTLLVAVGLLVAIWVQRRRGHVRPADLGSIVAESALWAGLMVVSVGWAAAQLRAALSAEVPLSQWLSLATALSTAELLAMGPLDRVVMAAGAGFHEELVFRVGLLAGGAHLLKTLRGQHPLLAWGLSALVSSLLFSAVHHLGPLGEPWVLDVFTFRTLAGLYLSAVYVLRGFAVAVYTHTLYDILVFFVF